jgi:glycosyltransferase involved in cell wall biosynthesis
MVAYNGANELRSVSMHEMRDLRRALGISLDAVIVSAVARLERVKGVDVLLDAIPRVHSRVAGPLHVVVVGEGSQRKALTAQAVSLGLRDSVHLVGQQTDIAPWFALADVVVMPSRREAFGVAAAEAMSCSKPLVASGVGGLGEVVDDGDTGVIVPPADPLALASGLVRLLTDPEKARMMGQAGRRRFLEKFTNERMVEAWIACYRAIWDHRP